MWHIGGKKKKKNNLDNLEFDFDCSLFQLESLQHYKNLVCELHHKVTCQKPLTYAQKGGKSRIYSLINCLLLYVQLKDANVISEALPFRNLQHKKHIWKMALVQFSSVQFSQSCPTLCDPMNCSTPGLPVHHQLPELTQTHVHRVGNVIQPSHPLSSPSPPASNLSQHQSLFQ